MKTAYVIRHSKRDEIIDLKAHDLVLLNDEGKTLARNFGKKLSTQHSRIKIISSPIKRCVQTGECILEAFAEKCVIEKSSILGEPGPFVYGDALGNFLELGTAGVVEALENGIELAYMRSEVEGANLLLNFLKQETNKNLPSTASVFITHDSCIAPFINFLTGEYFDETHWIEFLGGLKIQFQEDILNVERIYGKE